MNKLYIKNKTHIKFRYEKLLNKIVDIVCKKENLHNQTEINLIIIENNEMKKISKKYRNIDKTTDILSFSTNYKNLFKMIGYNMLGDIYISYEKIIEQSKKYNHSVKREWSYIFTHGIYHLLEYNHVNDDEEYIMNKKIEEIMKQIKVGRNV